MPTVTAVTTAVAKNTPAVVTGAAAKALIPGIDYIIVAGIIVGLIGGSLWRAEDARSKGWAAWSDSLIGSVMRSITLFIIAGITYQIMVGAGTLLAVPFTPGPAGAAAIGMIVGVKGAQAFQWFMQDVLGKKQHKGSSEPSYAAKPDPVDDDLTTLARRLDEPRKQPKVDDSPD